MPETPNPSESPATEPTAESTPAPAPTSAPSPAHAPSRTVSDVIKQLRPVHYVPKGSPVKNANTVSENQLSPLDKFAVKITDRIGSMGFFFVIFTWTILWCGYNILASQVPSLHWRAFDPFPAFVAYLLMSNVIQILLMPLIMVGQNLQGRHSEIRAELDFEINQKAEKEIMVLLHNLEHNTHLLIQLMAHLDVRVTEEAMRAIAAESPATTEPVSPEPVTAEPLADAPITPG